jgi:uncharacterized protein YjiS (DUF1127 family)
MTAITNLLTPAAASPWRGLATITAAFARWIGQLVQAHRNRSKAAALAGFDDRMLADIGLTRSDVRDAFAEPLWQDPTELLRTRALERRRARHGFLPGFSDSPVTAPPLAPTEPFVRPKTDRPARYTV